MLLRAREEARVEVDRDLKKRKRLHRNVVWHRHHHAPRNEKGREESRFVFLAIYYSMMSSTSNRVLCLSYSFIKVGTAECGALSHEGKLTTSDSAAEGSP